MMTILNKRLDRAIDGSKPQKMTLIARSMQSVLDMCDNELVVGKNMHCTFKLSEGEKHWLNDYFVKKGGGRFSVTGALY